MFVSFRTWLFLVSSVLIHWCSGAENSLPSSNKWSVSSQWSYSTHWKPGQEPSTQIKITQNSSPGTPNQLQSLFDKGKLPNLDTLIDQAIQAANQQLNTQVQQLNLQGQIPANQMHTFTIQTPQTGNQMQMFSIPWQKPDSQIPQSNFQPSQTNFQPPQQINQIRPINTQSPQIVNQQPQSNFLPPQPTNPMQQPMFQGQWPTNQMSNFQQLPTNQMPASNFQQPQSSFLPPQPTNPVQRPMLQGQWPTNQMQASNFQKPPTNQMPASNFQQPQSNSQKRVGENVVTEEDDDRPVWGEPIPDRKQQQQSVTTSTLPPPVIQKSNTSSLTFIVRDREFEPTVIPAAAYVKDSVSLRYCLSYCNIRFVQYGGEIAVVGGENARLNEFPHMVALGFSSDIFQGKPLVSWNSCGGSLISRNFVLTAAHCMFSDRGLPTQVRVGEHDLSTTEDGAQPQDLPIQDIIIHPEYNSQVSEYNDIALIKLVGHVTFTKYMRPACLHTGRPSVEDTDRPWKPIATGWGLTGFTDFPSDILQKVNLDIIDNSTCKNLVKPNEFIPSGVNEKIQLCAGVLAGGKDTCLGDSGGPLQVNNTVFHWLRECPMDIVGITSFGNQCANENSPSIYTRVSHYVPWIESVVWPGEK